MVHRLLLGFAAAACFAQNVPANLQIFLLIGQSNMVGRGTVEPGDREPDSRVWSLNPQTLAWQPAVDPLHSDIAQGGVGPGRAFGRMLARSNPGVSIGLVPAALGGSSLDEWRPGARLYTEALRRLRAALPNGKLRGVLWHQGERDSRDPELARTYLSRLGPFFEKLREDLGEPGLPIVVGGIGEFLPNRSQGGYESAALINEYLALTPVSVFRTAFVSSAGLGHIGDELHFNAASQRELGRRYALALMSLDSSWAPLPE